MADTLRGPQIIVGDRTVDGHAGFAHSGVRLKREYGGPPWWQGINGLWFAFGHTIVWVELFSPSLAYRGKRYVDLRRKTRQKGGQR